MKFTGDQHGLFPGTPVNQDAGSNQNGVNEGQFEESRRRMAQERLGAKVEYIPSVGYMAIEGANTEQHPSQPAVESEAEVS